MAATAGAGSVLGKFDGDFLAGRALAVADLELRRDAATVGGAALGAIAPWRQPADGHQRLWTCEPGLEEARHASAIRAAAEGHGQITAGTRRIAEAYRHMRRRNAADLDTRRRSARDFELRDQRLGLVASPERDVGEVASRLQRGDAGLAALDLAGPGPRARGRANAGVTVVDDLSRRIGHRQLHVAGRLQYEVVE